MNRMWIVCSVLGLLAVTSLMTLAASNKQSPSQDGKQFHDQLREIAKSYGKYRPVDYREAKWAPALCRLPIPYEDVMPAEARRSASKDEETHGQKLYFLFAKERESYLQLATKPVPVGQVVVKQSWQAVESSKEAQERYNQLSARGDDPKANWRCNPFTEKGDKVYRTGKQADLYIMFKMDPATPGTDCGWVYGTVTPDGKTVTSAGRVESCMTCHKDAPKDRLFGVKLKEAPWDKVEGK